jgi:F-type H+-transporting ATPase subunit epsilon
MANKITLEIVTPEGIIYSDQVDMVTLPGVDGELGIYPSHVPLVTQVVTGEIQVRKGYEEFLVAIGDGFVEITADRVAVMTDMAIKADDVDEAKAEEARQKAEKQLQQKLSGEELAAANAALLHSLAQISVKKKQKRH